MRASWLRLTAQFCILLALVASMALLVDTLGVTPAYCSGPTGCHAAKLAASRVFRSVPVPLLGLLAFSVWLVTTTFRRGRWWTTLELAGALIAAPTGVGLLLVQALVLKTFCPFCVVVDTCGIGAGIALVFARRAARSRNAPSWIHPAAVMGLGAVATIAPVLWPHFRPTAAMPPQLAAFEVPGRVSVVEFADLECSHCQALYPVLEQLRSQQGDRITFTRLHAPLRAHRQARLAARLVLCLLPDEGRAEQLTAALFESPRLDLANVKQAAEFVGMAEDQIQNCWNDPTSEAPLDDNVQLLESLGFQGLPTTYVGGERIVGAKPLAFYTASIDRVRRSGGSSLAEAGAFCAILSMLVLGLVILGRRCAAPSEARAPSGNRTDWPR